jgi:hypothetical protein
MVLEVGCVPEMFFPPVRMSWLSKPRLDLDPEVFIYLAISAELELLQASLVNAYPGLRIE